MTDKHANSHQLGFPRVQNQMFQLKYTFCGTLDLKKLCSIQIANMIFVLFSSFKQTMMCKIRNRAVKVPNTFSERLLALESL